MANPNNSNVLFEQNQFVLFLAEGAFKQGALMNELIASSRNQFDGDIVSLPTTTGLPVDIPRIILRNQHGSLELTASPERLTVTRTASGQVPNQLLTDTIMLLSQVGEVAKRVNSARISRLAMTRARMFEGANGAMRLIKYFVLPERASREIQPPGPLSRCANFEIHAHKTFQLNPNIAINSWVRCKTANRVPEKEPIISIEQDLNTLAEESSVRNFDGAAIVDIASKMAGELDSIFVLYFPEGIPS